MAPTPTAAAASPTLGPKSAFAEWIMPVAAVSLIFIMLVPVPSVLLDVFLALSLTVSVLVLLSAIQILRPSQFSVFPSLLLLLTLFRLSLNLASSRRILLHGNEGAAAAGHVIEAFGQFVVGGNYVVGFVLFVALIAIQYLVVAHGAVRTAEVTARFTLDAMPGKQMAIDADLNAGLINEAQARARREQVAHDAEFYGAMDGAARFNQRDAIATILITAINIVAGFLIGVFQLDIPFREALKTYRPTGVPAWRTARRALPVTSTVPRAACWPGASVQVTRSEARASGAGVARPPGAGVARAPASGLTAGPGAGTAPPPGVVAGPGAGTAALPAVNVTERPAAVSATSPGEDAVTGGTVPRAVKVRSPCAGRWTGCAVTPGHTALVPTGPSDSLTVSLVAAFTVAECRLASAETAAGGRAMVSVTPVGWMGLPTFATAGRRTVTPAVTGCCPVGNRQW